MGLTACSAPKKQEKSQPTLFERVRDQQKAMTTYGSNASAVKLGDKGGTGWLQRKIFGTKDRSPEKEYGGIKEFGGVKDYKTKGFSQSDKTSHFASQTSKFGTKDNRMGTQNYGTKDSRYSSKVASQDNKEFNGSNRTFKSGEYQPAKKSLHDNKQIIMQSGQMEDEKSANAYSESQVKRLLGR